MVYKNNKSNNEPLYFTLVAVFIRRSLKRAVVLQKPKTNCEEPFDKNGSVLIFSRFLNKNEKISYSIRNSQLDFESFKTAFCGEG